MPSYSKCCLAPVCYSPHQPTHPLTFIVLPGGDTEEAQDVYRGICPAWRRAPMHCGRVRKVAGRVGGLPALLPGRPHTTMKSHAFNLNSFPKAPCLRARAKGWGSDTWGQPGPHTVSLGAARGSEWRCSIISLACLHMWKPSLEIRCELLLAAD